MKEKKFFAYKEARLVKGDKNKWYIQYKQTNPDTLRMERKRPTFKLNKIKNLVEREKEAQKWIRYINARLPMGYPFKNPEDPKVAYQNLIEHIKKFLGSVPVLEHRNRVGEQLIMEIKKQLPNIYPFVMEDDPKNTPIFEALDWFERHNYDGLAQATIRHRHDFVKDLKSFLTKRNLQQLPIGQLTDNLANEVMHYIFSIRNINNNNYNKTIENAIIVFNYLEKNDFIFAGKNPFKSVKPKKRQRKLRRNISDMEKPIIKEYLKEVDYFLYLGAMLQYGCFIRPGALQELRFQDFNFQLGLIRVKGDIVKTSNTKTLTIPEDIRHLFVNAEFRNHPGNWYVFGHKCQPGPDRISEDMMRRRHLRYIRRLKQMGKLEDITGIQWYSWKDTGITDALRQMKPYWVQKQADHENYQTTLKYDHAGVINEGMLNFKVRF